MNRYFIFIFFVLTSILANGQNALMYEISGGKLKHSSYLFGTMHMNDESLFDWDHKVFDAIEKCDVAAFELNMQGGIKLSKSVSSKMKKEWESFFMSDLLPELERSIPADTLANRILGLYEPMMKFISGSKASDSRQDFVDAYLQNYAVKKGKTIMGIETVKEQVELVNAIDKQNLKNELVKFLKNGDWTTGIASMMMEQETMKKLYEKKDLAGICDFVQTSMNSKEYLLFSKFYKQMFDVRNQIMFDRTVKTLKKKSMFIAVGSGHLCGSSGLIEKYRAAGYTVTPIDISKKSEENTMAWKPFSTPYFSIDVPSDVDSIFDGYDSDWKNYYTNSFVRTTFTSKGRAEFYVSLNNEMEYNEVEYVEEDYDYLEMDTTAIGESEAAPEDMEETPVVEPDVNSMPYMQRVMHGVKKNGPGWTIGAKDLIQIVPDTLYVGTDNRMIVRTKSFTGTELKYTINPIFVDGELTKDGWNLEVRGDPALLKSEEILRFFTSFNIKN